jgi:hypothetical protein
LYIIKFCWVLFEIPEFFDTTWTCLIPHPMPLLHESVGIMLLNETKPLQVYKPYFYLQHYFINNAKYWMCVMCSKYISRCSVAGCNNGDYRHSSASQWL